MSQNPYQAAAIPRDTKPEQNGNGYSFRPLNRLAMLITTVMGIIVAAMLVMSLVDTIASCYYPGYTNPNAHITDDLEMSFVNTALVLALVAGVANIVLIVFVCTFLYRANANLRSLNLDDLEYTPGWCGGWWFIPFMNLFKPYYCTKEIYHTSRLSGSSAGPPFGSANSNSGSEALTSWWTFWLMSSFFGQIESRLALKGVDIGGLAIPLSWATTLTTVGAGTLFVVIVWRVTRWQS